MFKFPISVIFTLLAYAGRATGHDGLRGFGGGDAAFDGPMNGSDGTVFTNLTCSSADTLPACVPGGPGGRHREGMDFGGDGGFRDGFGGDRGDGFGGGDRPDFNDTQSGALDGFQPVNGTWVCRTLYNPINGSKTTFNECIDTNHALTTDECGCCDGVCPDPCECPCDLANSSDSGTGVLVQITSRYNATVTEEICVEPERAVSMVANGPATCKTACDGRA